jgi:esterase/lipase
VNENQESIKDNKRLEQLAITAWEMEKNHKDLSKNDGAGVMSLRSHRGLQNEVERVRGVAKACRSKIKVDENSDEAILLIHGSTGSPTDLSQLTNYLSDKSFTVYSMLLPDHGIEGDTFPTTRWKSCLHDVQTKYKILSQAVPRVHVIGFSFGAALAIHLADKTKPASLTLLAPALHPKVSPFTKLMLTLGVHRLPMMRKWFGWNLEVLEAMEKARRKVSKLRMPIYGAHCADDPRIDASSLRHLQRKSRHRANRFRLFPDGGHMILQAHGRKGLNREILEFIKGGKKGRN